MSRIKVLSISCTGLEIADVDHISYHVLKFSILEDLDLSVNLSLDTGAINRIVSSFAGHFAHQSGVIWNFHYVLFSLRLSWLRAGKSIGNSIHTLNLSGTNIEKLPDDIMKCLPKLKSLKLNECRALVFLPLSLAALKEVEVAHCSSLVYPPSSARATPQKVLQFLKDVDPTSEPWRRLKVKVISCSYRSCQNVYFNFNINAHFTTLLWLTFIFQIVFLGNGRSGKTSLLGTLAKRNLNPHEQSTRGIEVDAHGLDQKTSMLSKRKMGFPDMELTWWDFAGQLEYSAAHQCRPTPLS